MKISNVDVYGVHESVTASGYPMSTKIKKGSANPFDFERADKLANNPPGTGHNNFLKGIIVQFDLTAPQYIWLQAGRYHWFEPVSSQSKMHMITKMNIRKQCNKYVSQATIDELCNRLDLYYQHKTKENFQRVIANCPMGFMLTARITTNYLQLKTISLQRKPHKLEEWQIFCKWIEQLPHSDWIVQNDKN